MLLCVFLKVTPYDFNLEKQFYYCSVKQIRYVSQLNSKPSTSSRGEVGERRRVRVRELSSFYTRALPPAQVFTISPGEPLCRSLITNFKVGQRSRGCHTGISASICLKDYSDTIFLYLCRKTTETNGCVHVKLSSTHIVYTIFSDMQFIIHML